MPSIFGSMVVKNGIKQVIYNFSNARKKTYAQVQAMSDAEKQGVIICDDYPATEGYVHYKATEQKIGTWVDGSDLFAKTIDCGALPNNTNKIVAHNISNLKHAVFFSGFASQSANTPNLPLPYVNPASPTASVGVIEVSGNIRITTASDMSAYTVSSVTIFYTKTS